MSDDIDLDAILDTTGDEIKTYENLLPEEIPEGAIPMDHPDARVRLSYSTLELLHGCERKFQKTKLLLNNRQREESPAMSFGKAYGAAAQTYMILRTDGYPVQVALDSAIWECFKQYTPLLEDDRRFLERAIYCIQAAQPFHERMLMEWEIAQFEGKYAAELGFKLNISKRYYLVGFIDLVLRNRRTGRYAVTDYKSTSLRGGDLTPHYKWSDQTLGYSIVVDKIAGHELSEFDTNYWVAQLPSNSKASIYEPVFHDFCFPKTIRDRMEWFLKVFLDVNYMESLEQLTVYPKRSKHCTSWNRTCQFFNECQFTALDRPGWYLPDTIDYQFEYDLTELYQDHDRRVREL